jgi:hypothetical protein
MKACLWANPQLVKKRRSAAKARDRADEVSVLAILPPFNGMKGAASKMAGRRNYWSKGIQGD